MDSKLAEAARAWKARPTPEAESQLIREAVRSGRVTSRDVELAGLFGAPAAPSAASRMPNLMEGSALVSAIGLLGADALLRTALALSQGLLPYWTRATALLPTPLSHSAELMLKAIEAWDIQQPIEQSFWAHLDTLNQEWTELYHFDDELQEEPPPEVPGALSAGEALQACGAVAAWIDHLRAKGWAGPGAPVDPSASYSPPRERYEGMYSSYDRPHDAVNLLFSVSNQLRGKEVTRKAVADYHSVWRRFS